MHYTVEVTEVSSGDVVHQLSAVTHYTGEVVLYRVTTSQLTSVYYSVIVHLETGRWGVSSSRFYITNNSPNEGRLMCTNVNFKCRRM